MKSSTLTPSGAAGLAVCAAAFLFTAPNAGATLFWQADTNRGTAVFAGLNLAPGTVTVAPDPLGQFGSVYKFFLPDTNSAFGKERCESSGTSTPSGEFRVSYNTDYYIGWRALWNPMPINPGWVALFQMHGYGVTGQGAPLVLRCVNGDGNLYMQNNANGVDTNFWHTTFKSNVWQTFVLHVFMSTNWNQGYTEIWYNGVLQTNNRGTTRWYGPTWDDVDGVWSDSYNKLKWGCYRSGAMDGKGLATAYMSDAKIGSTYADVDPNGIGDFSVAGAPASQLVQAGDSTNFTVTVGALNGFRTNVSLSASGLPGGASVGFNPATITNSGASTMTLATAGSTPPGSYAISIVGTSGSLAHTNTVTLLVSGFALSVAPAGQTVNAGAGTIYTVTVTTNGSFSGSVALGLAGLPPGASASFVPTSLDGAGTSTLTVNTTSNTPGGSYSLTVAGTNGIVITAPATLGVNGAIANPGTLLWTGGSGVDTNWSTLLNWTNLTVAGNGPPGISNNVIVGDTGSGTTNVVDSSTAINSLWYQLLPASGGAVSQTTLISPNVTLTVAGVTNVTGSSFVTGNYSLLVGTNNNANGNGSTVTATITGSAGTLNVNNATGIVAVAQFNTSGNHPVPAASTRAVLDLSGLGTFSANIGQLQVGCMNNGSAGTLYLAQNNTLTLNFTASTYTTTAGQGLDIGFNNSNAGDPSFMYLGVNNSIFVNNAIIAACKGSSALLAFNPAFTNQNPSVFIRNVDGVDPVAYWNVGDLLTSTATANVETPQGTNDFTGGTVDLLVGALTVARTSSGASNPPGSPPGSAGTSSNRVAVGTLTFSAGTIAAINLTNGWQVPNMGTASSDTAIGTINVNGAGTLVVSNRFILAAGVAAYYVGGNPTNVGVTLLTNGYYGPTINATNAFAQGTLNLNGGTVQATNVIGGGGISTINLNSGTLDLQPDWAAAPGVISNLCTLNIGANGVSDPASLTGAARISTTNTLTIAPNGTVAGNTFISTPNLIINGVLSPGSGGAGAMTNSGSVTLGAGGSDLVTLQDATSGPAVGWSYLKVNGGIIVQAAAANPFLIQLQSPGVAANFSDDTNYNWTLVTATGGITNYDPTAFAVDNSLFVNDLAGGYFFVTTNGASLVLSFTNNHPPVAGPAAWYRTNDTLTIPLALLATNWSDPDGDPVTLVSVNSSSTNGANNVSTDGVNIYYTNADTGADAITYVVQDVRTNPPAVYQSGDTVRTAVGTVAVLFSDYVVVAGPASQATSAGGSVNFAVTVTPTNGFSGMVTLTVTGVPVGADYSLSQTNLNGAGSSTLNVTTSTNTLIGDYILTVTGTSGNLTHGAVVTLSVVPKPHPRITTVTPSVSSLVLSGTNGLAGLSYYVWAATNVTWPLSNWSLIGTSLFDSSGNFSFTNAFDPALRARFFLLQVP